MIKRTILALVMLCACLAAAQTPGQGLIVQVQNAGTPIGTFSSWLPINCSTNLTCTMTNGTIVMTSSATASAAFSSLTAATNSNAGTFAGSGNTWDFHAATAFLLPGSLSTGLLKVTTGTGALSTGGLSDITGLFAGCSGVQYLGFDGNCHTAGTGTVTGTGVNTQLTYWTGANSEANVTGWTSNGTTSLTGSSSSILSVDDLLNDLLWPGTNNQCTVQPAGKYPTVTACAAYFAANGLAGGIINTNTPEVWATNPWFPSGTQVSFTLNLGNGLSGVCDNSGSHNTCIRTSVPIILPSGADIQGQGAKVISIADNSNGSAITFSNTYPAATGPPAAAPTLVCSNSGGSIVGTPTVYVVTEYINNLQGSNGLLLPGPSNKSAEANCAIPAGGTGTNGSVTVTSPAGTPGTSPFQAQDFEICAANATGQEVCGRNSVDGSNPATITCGANGVGVVDPNACLLGSTATLTGLPIATANTFMPSVIDLTNVAIVMGQGNVSQTTYGSLLSRFSFNCNNTSHTGAADQLTNFPADNEPNVAIWYRNGQEASKIDMTGAGGPCGGYANSPGAYLVVSEPDGGVQGFNPGAGPCSQSHAASGATNCNTGNVNTTFYDAIFAPQTGQVLTIQVLQSSFNQRTSGQTNAGASVWVTGQQTNVTASGDHVENFVGGDGWRVDNGANLVVVGGQGVCTSSTKGCYHLTPTGGSLTAVGVTNTNPVLKPTIFDEVNSVTVTASGVGVPVTYFSYAASASVNALSAPLLASNSSGQIIAATVPVNATNGGTGLAGPTAHSLMVGEGSLHINLVTSPSTNGYCLVGFNVTASVAVDPLCTPPGVPVDATNPATLLYSDRASFLNWTSGTTLALPAVAGQFQNNFPFVLRNTSGSALTVVPNVGASDLCDGSATCSIPNNYTAFVYQDGTTAPGHWFTVQFPNIGAFPTSAKILGTNSSGVPIAAALTSAHIYVGNGSNLPADVAVSGDATLSNAGAVTNIAVNGTSVPTNAAADQVLQTTASATGAWKSVPICLDSNGNHLNYDTGAHAWSCGTSNSGSAGGTAAQFSTTAVTATNPSAEATLMELALPAAYLNVLNQPYVIHGSGTYNTATAQTPTITFKVKLCTVSGCGSGTVVTLANIVTTATIAAVTNNSWNINLKSAPNVIGASGTIVTHGPLSIDLGALTTTADSIFNDVNTAASSAINLSGSLFLDFTVLMSSSNASNQVIQQMGGISPDSTTVSVASGTNGDVNKYTSATTVGDAGFLATNIVRKDSTNTMAAASTIDASTNAVVVSNRMIVTPAQPSATDQILATATNCTTQCFFKEHATSLGASTIGTIDGTHWGVMLEWQGDFVATATVPTFQMALFACDAANYTQPATPGATACSSGQQALYTFTAAAPGATAGTQTRIWVQLTADPTTAGSFYLTNVTSGAGLGTAVTPVSLVACGATCNTGGHTFVLYFGMKYGAATAGNSVTELAMFTPYIQ